MNIVLNAGLRRYSANDQPDSHCDDPCARDEYSAGGVENRVARIDVTINRVVLVDIDAELKLHVFDARRHLLIDDDRTAGAARQGFSPQRRDARNQRRIGRHVI